MGVQKLGTSVCTFSQSCMVIYIVVRSRTVIHIVVRSCTVIHTFARSCMVIYFFVFFFLFCLKKIYEGRVESRSERLV